MTAPDDMLKLAEVIHKARWPEDRQMAVTPFADEDANGREYCLRIARSVLADRASAQRSGVGEPIGWFIGDAEDGFHQVAKEYEGKEGTTPLYAAPVPLSRCEVQSARCPHDMGFDNEIGPLGCRLVGLEMVCVCEHMHFASAAQAPLDWLAEHKNYELSFCGWDEDQVWELHSVNGGRNDREWTLRATGNTPEEALRKAMAMPSADGGPAA